MKYYSKKYLAGRIAAGLLATVVVAFGIFATSMSVNAEKTSADTVIYDNETFQMSDYYHADGEKIAPVLPGYVFGGWYEDDKGQKPLTEDRATDYERTSGRRAYAKFVPAYVLSVKAQNKSGTSEAVDKTNIRIVSSVDSKKYQNVGITLLLNNKNDKSPEPTTTVYTGMEVEKDGKIEVRTPKQIFGEASEFLTGWRIQNIAKGNYGKILYVRPYWTTMDGTKVEGLARYVHVEDGYKNLVSVPVNLMTDPLTREGIAAGALKVICNDPRFEVYDVQAVENGRILANMDYHVVNGNTVKIVENVTGIGETATPDGIFANVRFRLKDGESYTCGNGTFLNFTVAEEDFRNWDEATVPMNAWDVRH